MQMLDTVKLHVRFAGRSEDLDFATLGLRPDASDAQIRSALARHYDVSAGVLANYTIQREENAVIVRPVAIYGW